MAVASNSCWVTRTYWLLFSMVCHAQRPMHGLICRWLRCVAGMMEVVVGMAETKREMESDDSIKAEVPKEIVELLATPDSSEAEVRSCERLPDEHHHQRA